MLIVNADDWGRDAVNTDRTLLCFERKRISSVSAMVFMQDSERAAGIARDRAIDTGLHLNFTAPFTAPGVALSLQRDLSHVCRFLLGSKFSPQLFNPLLRTAFARLVEAQMAEFERLYGNPPARIDGHHHMHLAANILRTGLLPVRCIVRRNFTFFADEKWWLNRFFRRMQDFGLARRYKIADAFFALPSPHRRDSMRRIVDLAADKNVELEVHPGVEDEMQYLLSDHFAALLHAVPLASGHLHASVAMRKGIQLHASSR